MSSAFVGEVRAMPFGFVPQGWAPCQGQVLPISDNENLFQLIGTTYGGDGESTFALPNAVGPVSGGHALAICISLFGSYPMP